MTFTELLIQQLITGISNGMIIALIALGYTMVYGIIELINFAHGDLFTLGSFFALSMVGIFGFAAPADDSIAAPQLIAIFLGAGLFCGILNIIIERVAYAPLKNSPRLVLLVSSIGISFILINTGLLWGALPFEVFNFGRTAASPKDFPQLLPNYNLLGESLIYFTPKDLLIPLITLPLMTALTLFIRYSKVGIALRAVAQDRSTASLMGIPVNKLITLTFFIGGLLAGIASAMYALYNNSISFQMGYRVGMDAFTAAVLGGIGSMPGAVLGGVVIGILRSFSDQFIATEWTSCIVFAVLIVCLIFRPNGILGKKVSEKV